MPAADDALSQNRRPSLFCQFFQLFIGQEKQIVSLIYFSVSSQFLTAGEQLLADEIEQPHSEKFWVFAHAEQLAHTAGEKSCQPGFKPATVAGAQAGD